jgi:hypothetical protein
MELPYKELCLHTRNCAYTGQDISLLYYVQCSIIVIVWWLVGFVCEPTTYYPLLKMFLPLSNVFYFVVIAGGPVIRKN